MLARISCTPLLISSRAKSNVPPPSRTPRRAGVFFAGADSVGERGSDGSAMIRSTSRPAIRAASRRQFAGHRKRQRRSQHRVSPAVPDSFRRCAFEFDHHGRDQLRNGVRIVAQDDAHFFVWTGGQSIADHFRKLAHLADC